MHDIKRLLHRSAAWAIFLFLAQVNATASFSNEPPPFQQTDPDIKLQDHPNPSLPELIQILEERSLRNPNDPELWYQLGLSYAKADRAHEAVVALQKAVALDPVHVRAWENLGICLYYDHKPDDALIAFKRATDLGAANAVVWNDYAIILMQEGRLVESSAALDTAFRLNPKLTRNWNSRGILKEKQGDNPGAIEAFNQALQLDPSYAIGWCNLGLVQVAAKDIDSALASFQKAVQSDPKLGSGWVNLALAYAYKHQWKESYDAAQQAVKFQATDPGGWYALGHAAFGLRKWEEAEQCFQKAFDQLDPATFQAEGDVIYGDSLSDYALAVITIGHLDDADKIMQKSLALDPNGPRVLAALGELRLRQKRWEESRDASQKSLDIDPSVPRTWANMGTALMGLNRPPGETLRAYNKAVELQPTFDLAWWGAGQSNELLHQNDAAAEDYRKAVQANPNMIPAWQRLAVVTTDSTESDQAMAQVVALAPSDVANQLLWGALQAQRKNWLEAELHDRKGTEMAADNGLAWAQLGQALSAQKKYPDSITAFENATKLSSGIAPLELAKWWSGLAIAHISQGNDKGQVEWQTGLDAATQATTLDPSGAVYWWEVAACQKQLGHLAESSAALSKCNQLGGPPWQPVRPGEAGALLSLATPAPAPTGSGNLSLTSQLPPAAPTPMPARSPEDVSVFNSVREMIRNHQLDDALAAAQHEAEIHPDKAIGWYMLGDVEMVQRRFDDSVAALTTATTLDPRSGPAWLDLGNSLTGQKKVDEAMAAYLKAIDLIPNAPGPWEGLARCYAYRGDIGGAVDKLGDLAAAHPDSPFGWWVLGGAQTQQGLPVVALATLQKAADLKADYAPIWNDLGMAYGRGQQTGKAQECFNRALQLQPGYAEALNNLGYSYFLLGETDKAIDDYKQALQSNPKHTRALFNLTTAYGKENQWDLARQTCATLAQLDPQTAARLSQTFPATTDATAPVLPAGAVPAAPPQ